MCRYTNDTKTPCSPENLGYRPKIIRKQTGWTIFPNSTHSKKSIKNNCTKLPMPNNVVEALQQLSAAPKQTSGIIFTDKDGNIISDDDDKEAGEHQPG